MRKRWSTGVAAFLFFLLAFSCRAAVANIADQCRFWVSEGSVSKITDGSMNTAWKPERANPEARIALPDSGAAYIQINWTLPPTNYTLTEYDAQQNVISTHSAEDDNFACISQLYALQTNTKYVSLQFNLSGQGINKIRVYPEGKLPKTVIQWEAPHDKCDLMVISTHQDDEWLWFGAIIPYYDLVQNKDVQVVYMANCGRYRYAEALNGIAVSGVRTYPYFVGLKDKYDSTLDEAKQTWGGSNHIVEVMTEVIRRFKPEVILTHDWNGEYGHPQHRLTSRCMEYAIEAAADPSRYPESAQTYGAWQVKKLYRHLEEKDRIEFDWHVAYEEFGGRTGLQVATDSMNQHASQLNAYQVQDHGKYDNALFGLSYSAVGSDVEHNDLFENIAAAAPTPEPTPEATPTPEPVEEPAVDAGFEADDTSPEVVPAETSASDEPEPTAAPEAVKESGGGIAPIAIGIAAAAVGAGAAGVVLYRRKQNRRRRRRWRPSPQRPAQRRSTHRK